MDDPVKQVRDVVRGVTEPYAAAEIADNIEKYYEVDAGIEHPVLSLPRGKNSRDHLKGIYKLFRVNTINQKIWFHSVMFNEDLTRCSIDLTEDLYFRNNPLLSSLKISGRLLVILDLKKCDDGKYRITKQHDIPITDISWLGLASLVFPGVGCLYNLYKESVGVWTGRIGLFLLGRGWLGA